MAERTPCAASIGDDQRDLPEPARRRGDRLRRSLDDHRRISNTSHIYLLVGNNVVLPLQGGIFLGWFATGSISLRNSWANGDVKIYYMLGDHGLCGNPDWAFCLYRMACIKCPFFVPKDQALLIEASKTVKRFM